MGPCDWKIGPQQIGKDIVGFVPQHKYVTPYSTFRSSSARMPGDMFRLE
jgi:hypothetical protein